MNKILYAGFGLITVFNLLTITLGGIAILGNNGRYYAISFLFGLLINAFLYFTIPITRKPAARTGTDLLTDAVKVLWFLAFCYSLYMAFMGNMGIMKATVNDTEKLIFAAGIALFTCAGPIGLSKLVYEPQS
jgi:hypothetical protein